MTKLKLTKTKAHGTLIDITINFREKLQLEHLQEIIFWNIV